MITIGNLNYRCPAGAFMVHFFNREWTLIDAKKLFAFIRVHSRFSFAVLSNLDASALERGVRPGILDKCTE